MIHVFPIKSKGYGFYSKADIIEPLAFQSVVSGYDREWSAMQDFHGIARNHCAATSITNLMQLYLERTPVRSLAGISKEELFSQVHKVIPNGPIFNLEKYANRYFQKQDLPLTCTTLQRKHKTEEERTVMLDLIRREIYAGRPCALLVSSAMFGWHWVLCFGYAQYKGGKNYLLVEDNWHRSGLVLYAPDEGSTLQRVVTFQGLPKA